MNLVRVDFACNDPDNGVFAGTCERIELPDQLLELEAARSAPRFTDNGNAIRICRRWWRYERAKEHYGNWCWNAYWFDDQTATALICTIHKSQLFNCDQGESRLFNLWRLNEPLDAEFLHRLMVKGMLAENAA